MITLCLEARHPHSPPAHTLTYLKIWPQTSTRLPSSIFHLYAARSRCSRAGACSNNTEYRLYWVRPDGNNELLDIDTIIFIIHLHEIITQQSINS